MSAASSFGCLCRPVRRSLPLHAAGCSTRAATHTTTTTKAAPAIFNQHPLNARSSTHTHHRHLASRSLQRSHRSSPSHIPRPFSSLAVGDSDVSDSSTNNNNNDAADELYHATRSSNPKQSLSPSALVTELNRYIVGQHDAKKAVAVAMRNRWRRHQLPSELRTEVTPKNILLIGPTGSGKTEIARRLAKLTDSPFLKVEATKFTEVGFYGGDVDTIIKDLVRVAVGNIRQNRRTQMKTEVVADVEERLLDALGTSRSSDATAVRTRSDTKEKLRKGELDGTQIEIHVPTKDDDNVLAAFIQNFSPRKKTEAKTVSVGDARTLLEDVIINEKLPTADLNREAVRAVENDGIVFLDEIDKVCTSSSHRHMSSSADASAEGVQRDLLPLVEGTQITTPQGVVNTDHILFICSGAFHSVKPSDMLPELQGRLPIRVELKMLTEDDLYKILTVPENNLIRQQEELLKTEDIELVVTDEAVRELARIAYAINRHTENIGARRLHTVVTTVLDDYTFQAADAEPGTKLTVDKEYVLQRTEKIREKHDLSKYVL